MLKNLNDESGREENIRIYSYISCNEMRYHQ